MRPNRCYLIAIPLAALALGPVIYLASYAPRIAFGMGSVYGFIWYLGRNVARGAAGGLLAGLAAGVAGCQPRRSAVLAAVLGFAVRSFETLYLAAHGMIVPGYLGTAVFSVMVDTLAMAMTGYVAVVAAVAWERRWPAEGEHAPEERPAGYRWRL